MLPLSLEILKALTKMDPELLQVFGLQSPNCVMERVLYFLALMISANSGLREAPPTRNPSTSGRRAGEISVIGAVKKIQNILTKFLAVSSSDTAAVQNLNFAGDIGRDSLAEVGADVGVGLLCLSRSGDLSGADGPDRLVRDDDLAIGQSARACLTSYFLTSSPHP
jgi:hypothetical protein